MIVPNLFIAKVPNLFIAKDTKQSTLDYYIEDSWQIWLARFTLKQATHQAAPPGREDTHHWLQTPSHQPCNEAPPGTEDTHHWLQTPSHQALQ